MLHQDRQITNLGEFIKALSATIAGKLVWYRGQRRNDWSLLPNLARSPDLAATEAAAIKRFKQNAPSFLADRPRDEWEWIFLMQHHRGLTRLLDWSESPLVGLYFALETQKEGEENVDAVVWCLDPMKLNEHSGHRSKHARDVLAFGIDRALESYLPDQIGAGGAVLLPIAAIGPRNSARMVAQSGTFTIIHENPDSIEKVGDESHIWRLVVPVASKEHLRSELKLLGFNELMLFPDLERVALHTKELLE